MPCDRSPLMRLLTSMLLGLSLVTAPPIAHQLAFGCSEDNGCIQPHPSPDSLPSGDRLKIQQWLTRQQFDKLEEWYTGLQQRYEQGALTDWALLIHYQAFYDTAPENEPRLSQWIEAFPRSYPARLARGIYYRKVGDAKRGDKWIRDTPADNLAQLSHYLNLATDDLLASRPLTAKPIVSLVHLLNITKHRDGDLGNRYWLDEANRIDPNNYGARRRYLLTLTPRWGGSYEAMAQFVRECRSQQIPPDHLRIFEAIIHNDQANMLAHAQHDGESLVHYRHALTLLQGIHNGETLEALRGLIFAARKLKTLDTVASEIDLYLSLAPQDGKIVGYRGWIREKHGRIDDAHADFIRAAELGDAWSQLRVGQHLYYGNPPLTVRDPVRGLAWIRTAAQQGYEPAARVLHQLEGQERRSKP